MANNPYVNKVQYDGNTLIDLTSDTVVANKLAQGYTAHDASGAIITGTLDEGDTGGKVYQDQDGYIVLSDEAWDGMPTLQSVSKSYTPSETAQSETVTYDSSTYDGLSQVSISVGAISPDYVGSGVTQRSSSDLTASGATVTAPAGYYASQATKSVSSMTLPTSASSTSSGTSKATIGRSTSDQYINIPTGYNGTASYYKVSAVANGSAATPATSITANPTISVGSDGLITASVSGSKSVTPTVSAGYVSSGTAGTVSVSGSNTSQLSTQAAATISPTESEQTAVAAGKYTTGIVKVGAISSTYVGSGITSRSSSDLTASGATVTAPAGYYASDASKSVTTMTLPTSASSSSSGSLKATFNRSTSTRYLNIPAGYNSSAGYYIIAAVADGTAGTPTAEKGAVANNQVSITPKVTNTAGYISGGTISGTAITVTASELVSGSTTIEGSTISGETNTPVDVTNYASATVHAGDYTCTVSRTGSVSGSVGVKALTTRYSSDGDTFKFSPTDKLRVSAGGSHLSGKVYLDGTLVASDDYSQAIYDFIPSAGNISVSFGAEGDYTAAYITTAHASITSNGTHSVQGYAYADVDIATYYTCTISGTGNSIYNWVKKNNAGTAYYTNGDTFTFTEGDYLYIRCRATSGGCTITVNGSTAATATSSNSVYYTVDNPQCDVTIEMTYGVGSVTNVLVPSASITSITSNGVKSIGSYTFANVAVPGMSEDDLRRYLYRNSTAFTDIVWPSSQTLIGKYAFAGCSYFNPSSLPSELTGIGNYAFYDCTALSLTSLPSGITSLGDYAFQYCSHLALTSLPSGLTIISKYAFDGCPKLALTALGSQTTIIYEYAFQNCTSLTLSSFPSTLYRIDNGAFKGCSSLAITSIPSTVTSLGSNVFQSCTSITSMTISNGISAIPSALFTSCTSLTTLTISSGVTTIGASAFSSCTSLSSVSLPSSITSINGSAFLSCTSLTSISCDGVITTLSTGAFTGSANGEMMLESANFPNMAVSSLSTAFGSTTATNACHYLEFIDIGNTAQISSSAFANCYALETIVIRKSDSICTLYNVSAFLNTPMRGYNSLTGTVYVPSALISTYQTATNWKTLYTGGTLTFAAIEGSDYELS